MTTIEKGERRGFLVATGRSKGSSTRHKLYEFRCLLCDEGVAWKRPSSHVGISCGCLKSIQAKIWVGCIADAPTHWERVALHQQRFGEKMLELGKMVADKLDAIVDKEREQERPTDGSSTCEPSLLEEVPEPPTPNLFAELVASLPRGSGESEKPKRSRSPRAKSAKARKSADAGRQDENPTTIAELTTDESCEPLRMQDADEPKP